MFERTKISLVFWIVVFAVASWALGHFHVADSTGKMVTLTDAYSYYYDILIGIGIAIFLTELCPRPLQRPIGIAVELLAGIPSIIYGIWGLFVWKRKLPANKWFAQGLAASQTVIFGHTHYPGIVPLDGRQARYINTGSWFGQPHYVAIDDGNVQLKTWPPEE